MKSILLLLILALPCLLQAGDPVPQFTYEGEIAGVVCSVCSNHVKAALSKLPGVEKVTVLRGDKPGLNKLVIVSTSEKITQGSANRALGGDSRTYNVTSLAPPKQ